MITSITPPGGSGRYCLCEGVKRNIRIMLISMVSVCVRMESVYVSKEAFPILLNTRRQRDKCNRDFEITIITFFDITKMKSRQFEKYEHLLYSNSKIISSVLCRTENLINDVM